MHSEVDILSFICTLRIQFISPRNHRTLTNIKMSFDSNWMVLRAIVHQ